MRSRVPTIAFLASLVASPLPALADDAGGAGNTEEGGTVADAGTGDGGAAADSSVPPVVACDGALCDTLQGRDEFECAVASAAPGSGRGDACNAGLAAAAVAGCLGAARRGRRGAARPVKGGSRC
jgi:hypothetical protein